MWVFLNLAANFFFISLKGDYMEKRKQLKIFLSFFGPSLLHDFFCQYQCFMKTVSLGLVVPLCKQWNTRKAQKESTIELASKSADVIVSCFQHHELGEKKSPRGHKGFRNPLNRDTNPSPPHRSQAVRLESAIQKY